MRRGIWGATVGTSISKEKIREIAGNTGGGTSDGRLVLLDQATSEMYALYVSGGDLCMDKTETGAGYAQIVLTDQATGKTHKIYVSSGKLTMEEV